MGRDQLAHRIEQVAFDVRTEDRPAVAMGAGCQVTIDDQCRGPFHKLDQDALLVKQWDACDGGQHLRHDDVVCRGEVLHRVGRHDMREGKQAQAAALRRIGNPANEEATALRRSSQTVNGTR